MAGPAWLANSLQTQAGIALGSGTTFTMSRVRPWEPRDGGIKREECEESGGIPSHVGHTLALLLPVSVSLESLSLSLCSHVSRVCLHEPGEAQSPECVPDIGVKTHISTPWRPVFYRELGKSNVRPEVSLLPLFSIRKSLLQSGGMLGIKTLWYFSLKDKVFSVPIKWCHNPKVISKLL